MFSAQFRLRNSKQIAQIFQVGKYIHGKYIFIKYLPNKKAHPRIAISVSTKFFKQAVKRNRIKRLIRESIKSFNFKKIPSLDILIITKKTLGANITLSEIQKDINNIFSHLS
jgi:ribonuclease P protein component